MNEKRFLDFLSQRQSYLAKMANWLNWTFAWESPKATKKALGVLRMSSSDTSLNRVKTLDYEFSMFLWKKLVTKYLKCSQYTKYLNNKIVFPEIVSLRDTSHFWPHSFRPVSSSPPHVSFSRVLSMAIVQQLLLSLTKMVSSVTVLSLANSSLHMPEKDRKSAKLINSLNKQQ